MKKLVLPSHEMAPAGVNLSSTFMPPPAPVFGQRPNSVSAASPLSFSVTCLSKNIRLMMMVQPRRQLLSNLSAAAAIAALWACPAANASVSKRVRLKDVENPKMQDALRAAVAGDLETADKLFSELLLEDPRSASVWSNRGSVRISLKLFEEARDDLTKATQLAPDAPVPFLNRAIALEALGQYQEAIADCKTAIENDPEEYAAWFNLGNVDLRVNKYEDALVAYERASLLAPGIAGYRFKQALVLFQLKRSEEARRLLQGLVRKYPNYAEARAALAAVLWSEGDRSRAEEQFSEATRREPLYSDIRWVNSELQWPPDVVNAMKNFLSII